MPGQEFVEPSYDVVVDPRQHIGQVGFGIEVGELGCLDNGHRVRDGLATRVGAGEQIVFAPDGNREVILPVSGRK